MASTSHTDTAATGRQQDAYAAASVPGVQGLYPSFHTALAILRIARASGELDAADAVEQQRLNAFYQLLDQVERNLQKSTTCRPFVVVVEGLDGCGKSTLVQGLSHELGAMQTSTPTASMAAVRDVFDKRGGAVSRAFYMVSNYVLWHEVLQQQGSSSSSVVVIDRWYSSTCAYSIGWKNTSGGVESVDALEDHLFEWPQDLAIPDLVFILKVDDEVRRQRVASRGALGSSHNPWDDRLAKDENLGRRILRGLERVQGPKEVVILNANQSKEKVLQEAVEMVRDRIERHAQPWDYFRNAPLDFFRWTSSSLGLCSYQTGRRLKHAPWAFQVALNGESAPSLRSVGIHSVDEGGILFFTWGHPGGGLGGSTDELASMVWVGGDYPHEQQWRAEGILLPRTRRVCELMETFPPDSLVAQIAACHNETVETVGKTRVSEPKDHGNLVAYWRRNPSERVSSFTAATVFVPLRMEVLIGGPSSPGGPKRFEWHRHVSSDGWSKARHILPFSPPNGISGPQVFIRPVTVALMGSHCSGKSSIGKELASILGWKLDPELGDVLRKRDSLVSDGHKHGDGSTAEGSDASWDEKIFNAECDRDKKNTESRVVETWHIGNLAWALMRLKVSRQDTIGKKIVLCNDAESSIYRESGKASVLLVQLQVSPETSIRRRKEASNTSRIPMADEVAECSQLYDALQVKGEELLDQFAEKIQIPVLKLENNLDGTAAMQDALRSIVDFVNKNSWRRAAYQAEERMPSS